MTGRGQAASLLARAIGMCEPEHQGAALSPTEEKYEFDDKDDYDRKFEDKAAGLVELIDHEPIELAGGAELLFDQAAIIGNTNFYRNQIVQASVEHVAEELDGVVDFFGEFHHIETNRVYTGGLFRQAPVAEAAALVFEKPVNAV